MTGRAAEILAVALASGAALPAQDTGPRERVAVTLALAGDTVYRHQVITVRVEVRVEERFLEQHLVQPFHRRLDLPVQVTAPWLEGIGGRLEVAGGGAAGGASLVVGDRVATAERIADRTVDGRTFAVFTVRRRMLPLVPGELVLDGPELHLTHATRFREDLVHGRVAEDPQELTVTGTPRRLRVLPLPVAGRPPSFTGAVGRFDIAASVDRTQLTVGESFELTLRVTGEGNSGRFEPPRLDGLEGFHVRGRVDREDGARTTVYELVPLHADLEAVPAVPFAWFEPGPPAGYETAHTEPVPVHVAPAPGAGPPETAPERSAAPEPLPPRPASPDPWHRPSDALLATAVVGPWLLALLVLGWRRRRAGRRWSPEERRARRAAATFRHRGREAEPTAAFVDYLAARLHAAPAEIVGGRPAARLEAAGVPGELARRAAAELQALVDARYAGAPPPDGDRVADTVEALERAFRVREDGR